MYVQSSPAVAVGEDSQSRQGGHRAQRGYSLTRKVRRGAAQCLVGWQGWRVHTNDNSCVCSLGVRASSPCGIRWQQTEALIEAVMDHVQPVRCCGRIDRQQQQTRAPLPKLRGPQEGRSTPGGPSCRDAERARALTVQLRPTSTGTYLTEDSRGGAGTGTLCRAQSQAAGRGTAMPAPASGTCLASGGASRPCC